jgi:hypothetical protein
MSAVATGAISVASFSSAIRRATPASKRSTMASSRSKCMCPFLVLFIQAERVSAMPEMSSAQPENVIMRISNEMHIAIVEIGGPAGFYDNRESWLAKAARSAGVNYRTAKGFFYREYLNPNAVDVDRVREARARLHAKNESLRHAATLDSAADALCSIDETFHRAEIDRLRDVARHVRSAALGQGVKL